MNDSKDKLLELYYEFYRVFEDVVRAYNTPGASAEYLRLVTENDKRWRDLRALRTKVTKRRDVDDQISSLFKLYPEAPLRFKKLWEAHIQCGETDNNLLRCMITAMPNAPYNQIDLNDPNGLTFPWVHTYCYACHPDTLALPPVDSPINGNDNKQDDMAFIDFQGLDDF